MKNLLTKANFLTYPNLWRGCSGMQVLYMNNCWFTNVGEAFIDIGGMELTRQIFTNANICCFSDMSWYYSVNVAHEDKCNDFDEQIRKDFFNAADFLAADYVVVPGMCATEEAINKWPMGKMIKSFSDNGSKIIFLGMGGFYYDKQEINAFSKYLDSLNLELIVTRDGLAYESYKNDYPCSRGIDCAFWVEDVFKPKGFRKKEYDVVTFNRSTEPEMFQEWCRPIVRPWHMQFSYKAANIKRGVLISDTPYDYLSVYANANRTYTDLVHASIVSLMYGVPVKYWYIDKRSAAFEAIENLTVQDDWMTVDNGLLNIQKENIKQDIIKRIR